jgi:polyhydroxybutyrate depolymerase
MLLACLVVAACGSSSSSTPAADAGGSGDGATAVDTGTGAGDGGVDREAGPLGGDRPVSVHVPPSYTQGTPMPLVVLLHGYGSSGAGHEAYMHFQPLADARGFLYAYPDGLVDSTGKRFWNGTDACCDLFSSGVDDATYLSNLITQIEARYSVDAKRVYLIGHSNGSFMAFRMACEHSEQITAIATLAGAMFADVAKCKDTQPVGVLHIHSDVDTENYYEGGTILAPYAGAVTTVNDWVTFDGCGSAPDTTAAPLDLDQNVTGAETTVTRFASGCKPGGGAELWTMHGSTHVPTFTPAFAPGVIDFLLAHAKP